MPVDKDIDILMDEFFEVLDETKEIKGGMTVVKYKGENNDELFKMKINMSYEDFSSFFIHFLTNDCEFALAKHISLELAKFIIVKELDKIRTLTDPNFSDLCKVVKL